MTTETITAALAIAWALFGLGAAAWLWIALRDAPGRLLRRERRNRRNGTWQR